MTQAEEIKTIKPRSLSINLSDADVERISRRAESHGITVAQLLENFIGDLVGGTYTNGSDERMYADQWFDRCWFGMFPDQKFLQYVLEYSDVDDFLSEVEFLEECKFDLSEEEDPDEIEFFKEKISETESYLSDIYNDYLKEFKPKEPESLDEAIQSVKDYKTRLEAFGGVENE